MKTTLTLSLVLLILPISYASDVTQHTDAINVPYLGNLDIMGYKLGENLSTALEKTDLLLAGDYGYDQIFDVVQPPKKSIKSITLFYAKQRGKGQIGGNNLYHIHIKYSNEHTDRHMLKLQFPAYKGTILKDYVNQYGIYQYQVSYQIPDSLSRKNVTLIVNLADRPDGQLWVDYYLKDVSDAVHKLNH